MTERSFDSLVFGVNYPRLLEGAQTVIPTEENLLLTSSTQIDPHMKAFFESGSAQATYTFLPEQKQHKFVSKSGFGAYFSLAWSVNDDLISACGEESFVTVGCDELQTDAPHVNATLNIMSGKNHVKREAPVSRFDGRNCASFLLGEDYALWNRAQSVWVDFIVSGSDFKEVSLTNPIIWAQRRIVS